MTRRSRALPAGRRRLAGVSPLARAITLTLAVKLCVVVAMRLFLFDGAHRPAIDESVMDDRLTASASRRS